MRPDTGFRSRTLLRTKRSVAGGFGLVPARPARGVELAAGRVSDRRPTAPAGPSPRRMPPDRRIGGLRLCEKQLFVHNLGQLRRSKRNRRVESRDVLAGLLYEFHGDFGRSQDLRAFEHCSDDQPVFPLEGTARDLCQRQPTPGATQSSESRRRSVAQQKSHAETSRSLSSRLLDSGFDQGMRQMQRLNLRQVTSRAQR